MASGGTDSRVDAFLSRADKWREEFEKLRAIILDCGLSEELKWGNPCYTLQDRNIVLIHGFKEYCAILFFKGALLRDPKSILIRQTENVQASRQIRFTNIREICDMEDIMKAYINEAIENERSGRDVEFKKNTDYTLPDEFQSRLNGDPALKAAFEALTPGRQRAYILYFSEPKQSKTRASRIEKCAPKIQSGKGLND